MEEVLWCAQGYTKSTEHSCMLPAVLKKKQKTRHDRSLNEERWKMTHLNQIKTAPWPPHEIMHVSIEHKQQYL